MAARTADDDLYEFFDFDQLEHDHAVQGMSPCGSDHADSFYGAGDVVPMDWITNEPVLLPTTGELSFDDMHLPDILADIGTVNQSPWPLKPIPAQLSGDEEPTIEALPSPSFMGNGFTADDFASLHHISSNKAPSSNWELAHRDLTIRESGDTEDFGVAQVLPSLKLTASTCIEENGLQPRDRPIVPTRQGSSASWKPASAKRKGPQSRIPLEARQILEDEFVANPYPCSWEMDIIAHQANLEVKKVRNWFNNTRARKKGEDIEATQIVPVSNIGSNAGARLSKDSLEALDEHVDLDVQPPQPLAVYLAQSYREEGIEFPDVQAAIDNCSSTGSCEYDDNWTISRRERTGSVINSVASSEGTAPTTYTVSSSGSRSNISSFGRDRRRGRRRMAWKESPYNNRPKFNGVNSAGEPQKDLPFFCTFCPRAFKTKYEWIRHEDSVHALRTTWICCDTKSALLDTCPFCGLSHPDDAHMAGHKYQQCWNKPESQRTFYRRDHFVQHLHHVHFANTKHPSVRVGCQARLMATEGHNFGCKDLAMKWRRFGAPMKQDDPMLHCGMCGKKSKDWSERCEHVAEHLIARELDRSAWWSERKENHLENLYSASPFQSFRCRYCLKIFTDVKEMNAHSHCKVWSCRFLKSFDDITADNAGPPLCPDFPSAKAHHCHLCGSGYRTPHSEHAQSYHRYRSCQQEFYTSEEAFLQHLHTFHGASSPVLLQGSSVVEQNFLRNKGASFEPVEFNESWQPCLMDLDDTTISFSVDRSAPTAGSEKRDHGNARRPTPLRRKTREESHQISPIAKAQRQRSDTAASKAEIPGPRFFRLSTYVQFLSSRIFYSHNFKPAALPKDSQAVLEEMPKPHVASLVMSAGLVSMAATRWTIKPKLHASGGMVELTIDEADWPS